MKYCDTNPEKMYSFTEICISNIFSLTQKGERINTLSHFLLLPDYEIKRLDF